MVVFYADYLIEIEKVMGFSGCLDQLHTCLLRSPVSFLMITHLAGNYQVFPTVISAKLFWYDVINGKRLGSFSTILTAMVVPNH